MQLSEVFTQLSYGELSQISLGGGEQPGIISEKNYGQLIAHVNLGLLALYKRFPLKENSVTVELRAGKITYPLKSDFAVTSRRSRETYRYILDTQDAPFKDDIFKIERVYTDDGYELGLNDPSDEFSISTPSSTILQVPWVIAAQTEELADELKTTKLKAYYRAMHPVLSTNLGAAAPRTELELQYSHLEPLLLFVASRVNNPIGITNAQTGYSPGNNYAAKYEQACQALETQNLRVDQGAQNNRLHARGFV